MPAERLQGMVAPNGAGPLAGGMGSPSQVAAPTYRTLMWGWQPPTARAHRLGGRGAQAVVSTYGAPARDGW